MTREQMIESGRVWQVYRKDDVEAILFEGSHAACVRYLREQGVYRAWMRGRADVSMGRVIWEEA